MNNKRRLQTLKKVRSLKTNDIFKWRFNAEGEFIEASDTGAYLWEGRPGQFYWVWEGWTGSHDTNDIFFYDFSIPYVDDEIIDRSFTLGTGGLTFDHAFSKGNGQLDVAPAHSATVHIKLDPKTRQSEGYFETVFLGIHQSPEGKFSFERKIP
ncbi:hypothetical protein PSUM_15740 [Pseudomonas umsongensis]|uniref:Uncharacterized protein n=1 Tax=Pseudomonas umsongensis TaxID=198618 RepID=A0ABX4DY75_9PSED|nr:hypothetical protein [Pseudomonas umsongensis]MBT9574936.1 hypothetical protein [Pseudomonas umsongensis]OXR33469.1 hypothetical protein PSUM_15740 [Pseudomonas umsongensis]SDS60142.1 hypothetical protein SAMN04490206_1056 [Pseudomonas umsongensis]